MGDWHPRPLRTMLPCMPAPGLLLYPPGLGLQFPRTSQPASQAGFWRRPLKRRGGKPSPAKLKRDAERWNRRVAAQVQKPVAKDVPAQLAVWSKLDSDLRALLFDSGGVFQTAFCHCEVSPSSRHRGIFPLPMLLSWPDDAEVPLEDVPAALCLANACLASLNLLWADFKETRSQASPTAQATTGQLEVHTRVAHRVRRMLQRMRPTSTQDFAWDGGFARFETGASLQCEPLRGTAVDLPERAGTCNPLAHIHEELRRAVADPSVIFPDPGPHIPDLDGRAGVSMSEYLVLVSRELACGKLRLRRRVSGMASVFAVKKAAVGRQRKIWNGAELSRLASQPPRPERLANPASFLDIHVEAGEAVYYSKRDAATFFDSLQVPPSLQPWFGQPAVSAAELAAASGQTLRDLSILVDDLDGEELDEDCLLHPVNVVWPMGFSWSSAVAQSTTLSVVTNSGVQPDAVLCMEQPPPLDQSVLCWVATDDTVFAHRNRQHGAKTLARFDAAMDSAHIPRNAGKDVSLASHITALGCDFTSQPYLVEPATAKLSACFVGLMDVLDKGWASPKGLNGLLGLVQWFCLLQRPVFAVFDKVYAFVRKEPALKPRPLPLDVRQELAVALGLLPLLTVSLDRPYLNKLLACDAAPEFGFGVCAAKVSPVTMHQLGILAERRGDYVRLHRRPGDADEIPRLGTPHRLHLPKQAFKKVISSRARWQAHSGVLEAHGLLLALKWAARSRASFHKKLVVLVDAKVVLGAASKGRTSAPALRGVIRAISAHSLACDFLVRLVYIPSEDNPADAPSRGQRVPVKKTVRKA